MAYAALACLINTLELELRLPDHTMAKADLASLIGALELQLRNHDQGMLRAEIESQIEALKRQRLVSNKFIKKLERQLQRDVQQIRALQQRAEMLLEFLENSSKNSSQIIGSMIRDAAFQAKFSFEVHTKYDVSSKGLLGRPEFIPGATAEFDSIIQKAKFERDLAEVKKEQRQSLHGKAIILMEFLEKSSHQRRQTVEAKVRDAAYEAGDIVECQISDESDPRNYLKYRDLDNVIAQFDSIIQEVQKTEDSYHNEDLIRPRNSLPVVFSGPALSHQAIMVGSNNNLEQVKKRLMESTSELEVIPIVGMGGIGKTTLATTLYKDRDTLSHFPTRAWVTISQTYGVPQILRAILESVNMLTDKLRNEDEVAVLSEQLYQILMKSARYLIVLDDVWDTDAWDAIARVFPKRNNGSRVIITTRLQDVADYVGPNSPSHEMQFLGDEESWNLLQERVFAGKYCPSELEDIGRNIAKSCKGLPLAIVVVGGLLAKLRRTQDEWKKLANNVNNSVTTATDDEQCLKILSLSYNHLPQHLKACFLYMGVFPEDAEISTSRLIKLWVAEGFLKQETPRNMEQVAEANFEELVGRNLILVRKKRFDGKIKTCGIHDQLRNLCLKEAQKDNFFFLVDKRQVQVSDRIIRRISFHSSELIPHTVEFTFCRSLLCPRSHYNRFGKSFFSQVKLLRVLVLHLQGGHTYYPEKIEALDPFLLVAELIHLRYICFKGKSIFSNSITKLRNLQTLIIREGVCVLEDFGIWKMPLLQHVIGCEINTFSCSAGPRICLQNLRSLVWIEHSLCTKEVLEQFPNLRKLGIHSWEDKALCISNLDCLEHLETLKCESEGIQFEAAVFREKPTFPKTLKKLTLNNTAFSWKDMRIVGSLPNLQVLKLKDNAILGPIWEPSEGEFPQLKVLQIEDLYKWKEWRAESAHFPNLQKLILKRCMYLLGIPNGIADIPTLETIELCYCGIFVETSAKEIQQEQEDMGNDLQVLVYPIRHDDDDNDDDGDGDDE